MNFSTSVFSCCFWYIVILSKNYKESGEAKIHDFFFDSDCFLKTYLNTRFSKSIFPNRKYLLSNSRVCLRDIKKWQRQKFLLKLLIVFDQKCVEAYFKTKISKLKVFPLKIHYGIWPAFSQKYGKFGKAKNYWQFIIFCLESIRNVIKHN